MAKRKQKPNPKRPQLWFQLGHDSIESHLLGARLRIFYPDGKTEWLSLSRRYDSTSMWNGWRMPCWDEGDFKGMGKSKKAAKDYDAFESHPEMEFVANL